MSTLSTQPVSHIIKKVILYSSVQTLFGLNKDYGMFLARTVLSTCLIYAKLDHGSSIVSLVISMIEWEFFIFFHKLLSEPRIYIEKLKLHMKIIYGDAFQRIIIEEARICYLGIDMHG